jgi:hypothetical protein
VLVDVREGVGVGVRVGTNPNSRRLEYAEPGALTRKLTNSGLLEIRLLTALIIFPKVANCEMIAPGVGVAVGIGVSVEIGNEAKVAVTLAEGEVSAGVIPALGVEMLVGVNADVGDETVGVVVNGDETAGVVAGDAIGVGAGARLAIAITWSRSLRAS